MVKMGQIELANHRVQIIGDVKDLVEKYREVFDWDAAEVDQRKADQLIVAEIANALHDIENHLLG